MALNQRLLMHGFACPVDVMSPAVMGRKISTVQVMDVQFIALKCFSALMEKILGIDLFVFHGKIKNIFFIASSDAVF